MRFSMSHIILHRHTTGQSQEDGQTGPPKLNSGVREGRGDGHATPATVATKFPRMWRPRGTGLVVFLSLCVHHAFTSELITMLDVMANFSTGKVYDRALLRDVLDCWDSVDPMLRPTHDRIWQVSRLFLCSLCNFFKFLPRAF